MTAKVKTTVAETLYIIYFYIELPFSNNDLCMCSGNHGGLLYIRLIYQKRTCTILVGPVANT